MENNAFKKGVKQVVEIIKLAMPSLIIYAAVGGILMMLTMKEDGTIVWDNAKFGWTALCFVLGISYNVMAAYSQGGVGYDMLVSGNKQRRADDIGTTLKISKYNEYLEYREWKGFVCGFVTALPTLILPLVFGANEEIINKVHENSGFVAGADMGVIVLVGFFLSGWTLLPCFYLNGAGIAVSYYYMSLFALVPILVTGFSYIWGAYAKRNKALRMVEERAEKQAREQAVRTGKVNYGALPGTQPKKRK